MKKRKTVVITGIVIVCLLVIGLARYIEFPALHRGIPQTLQPATADMDLTLINPRYYCISSFLDSEWLWKAKIPEQDMKLLADKLEMQLIPSGYIEDQFFDMPPYWWRPAIYHHTRVFATTNFPMRDRGPDGWHALATWNPYDGTMHMWIKDNF